MKIKKYSPLLILASVLASSNLVFAWSTDFMPSSIEEYNTERKQLLNENSITLSPKEEIVNQKLQNLKAEAQKNYNPSRPFYEHVNPKDDKAYKTDLFRFLLKMPKGANLHTHSSSLLSVEGLFNLCERSNNICIYIYKNNKDIPFCELRVKGYDEITDGFLNFSDGAKLIGRENVINEWINGEREEGRNPWEVFEENFSKIRKIFKSPEIFKGYYTLAFSEQAYDNTQRLEIRIVSSDAEGQNLKMFQEAYNYVKNNYHDEFTVKIIFSDTKTIAKKPLERIDGLIDREIDLQNKFKDGQNNLFIGIDLVGEEDAGQPLKDFAEHFIKAKNNGKKYDLYLHAGESVKPENNSLADAYLLGSLRIGHGFNLYRYPEIAKKLIERNIVIEVCPISNQILGYAPDLSKHHAREYIKAGVPVVLASDDPGMFYTKGLSYDFYVAVLAWDLNLADIKQFCINSVNHSGGTGEERQKLKALWQNKWDNFINEMSK